MKIIVDPDPGNRLIYIAAHSLIVPDFKMFVDGSSCKSLIFSLHFFHTFFGIPYFLEDAFKKKRKERE